MSTKNELLRTIRNHCLECCGGSWVDVQDCTSGPNAGPSTCNLWPYRLGKDPNPSESRVEAGKIKAKFLHPAETENGAIS